MDDELRAVLREYGLNEKEAEVYLALLEIGLSKVNAISEKADILRETTYGILKSLTEKGLVSYSLKGTVKYYSAADPDRLIEILRDKESKISEILPRLKEFQKFKYNKPKVKMYEGPSGLKTVYREIIKEKHTAIYSLLNIKFFNSILPYFAHNISEERKEKGIKSFVIVDESVQSKEVRKRDASEFRETRIHSLLNNMKTGVYIYGNNLAFFSFSQKEPIAVVIENEEIAESMKLVFDEFWKQAKK